LKVKAFEPEHLSAATTMYREMGLTYWREKAETELVPASG